MEIKIKFLTTPIFIQECALFTQNKVPEKELKVSMISNLIDAEHSPIEALMLTIDIIRVPYWVSVHFVRHSKTGQRHFVTTSREDITGKERSPSGLVNHRIVLDYHSLMAMSHRRLCSKASKETREVMERIKEELKRVASIEYGWEVGQLLYKNLVPMCEYRGNKCHEIKSCGRHPK